MAPFRSSRVRPLSSTRRPLKLGSSAAGGPEDGERFAASQAAQSVSYTEVRYDPVRAATSNYTSATISQEAAVAAVSAGLRAGAEKHGVAVYSLLCAMRGKPAAACDAVADLAASVRSQELGGVVGLDLAGDELDYNNTTPFDYVPCFQRAKRALGLIVECTRSSQCQHLVHVLVVGGGGRDRGRGHRFEKRRDDDCESSYNSTPHTGTHHNT